MSPALQATMAQVVPSYMQAVYRERERQVVMAVLEALTGVLRSCGTLILQPPGRLAELCNMLKAVLQRKVSRAGGLQPPGGDGQMLQIQLLHTPTPHHLPERRRGRRAQAELSYVFLQTACQDTEEEEEDEDQVRAWMQTLGPGSVSGSLHRAGWTVHLGLA